MKNLLVIVGLWVLVACNSSLDENDRDFSPSSSSGPEICQDLGEGWSIPTNQIVDGGVGKDGIPAIEDPKFISVSEFSDLVDDEVVVGINVNGEYRAYPHRILEKHEIVNDRVGDKHFSVTFCPLTGTSVTWFREADNSFGVSGLLHNSNLVSYDRKTDSNWAQIYSLGINGDGICSTLDFTSTIEMSWEAWRTLFPDSKVLSKETGFNRNYNQPPESYNQPLEVIPIFPIYNTDNRLPNYERVLLVVIDDDARAYRLSTFNRGTSLVPDFLGGSVVTLVGNEELNFIIPLISTIPGERYFSIQDGNLKDIDGNIINFFGDVLEGPNEGERLEIPYSMMGYWFAIAAFYPDVDIFSDGEF